LILTLTSPRQIPASGVYARKDVLRRHVTASSLNHAVDIRRSESKTVHRLRLRESRDVD
jgi:hypothetical protein